MMLHAKGRSVAQGNATIGTIEEAAMSFPSIDGQSGDINGKAMVHGNNFHLIGGEIHHRMIGAMVALTVIGLLAPLGFPPMLVVLIGTLCAMLVCVATAWSMEKLAYRPLRHAPRLAPLITAIGVSIILQHLAMLVWSRNVLAFPQIIHTVS